MCIFSSKYFRFFLKVTIVISFLFINRDTAKANPGVPVDKVYITVETSDNTLLQFFKIVESQTSFFFAYDENEVNVSQKMTLETGQRLLSSLLNTISKQTGLKFTQKNSTILVNATGFEKNKAFEKLLDVKGVVQDMAGKPLAGATVTVKGTHTSVQTDADGNFSITALENATLIISFIGYKSQEVALNGRSVLLVNIEELSKDLNEVVVMGYQTQKRSELTGAVSVVNMAGLDKLPVGNVDQALQGKASGVRITQSTGQPGEGVAIRIRGVGTINDNNPLFIIDGIPTKDGINFLSANDIESITILKDAASAAIYGARSANGVIVITTKSGKKGKPQFNYSGYAGVQTHGELPKMLNTAEYVEIYNEAVANDNVDITNATLKRKPIPDTIAMANTDWLNAIFQNGLVQSHQLSVTGGNDKTLYYVSGNYFKQNGIILNSWYERYSMRSKLNVELTDKLSIANNINISYSDKNVLGSSGLLLQYLY